MQCKHQVVKNVFLLTQLSRICTYIPKEAYSNINGDLTPIPKDSPCTAADTSNTCMQMVPESRTTHMTPY